MRILTILLLFFPLIINAQDQFNLDCEVGIEKMDTVLIENKTVSYKVIRVNKLYTKGTTDFYDGIIILTDTEKLSESELKTVINQIGEKYRVNELLAFKNCDAIRIYYQAMKLLPEQEKFLKESLIGNFKIE